MEKPIQLYLEWEIKMHLDLLKLPISKFAQDLDAYKAAIEYKLPLTVNQFRRANNASNHPDDRGEKFVFEIDEPREGDNLIPLLVLINAWSQIVITNSSIENGRATREELIAAYPELHERAVLAAKELGVELP